MNQFPQRAAQSANFNNIQSKFTTQQFNYQTQQKQLNSPGFNPAAATQSLKKPSPTSQSTYSNYQSQTQVNQYAKQYQNQKQYEPTDMYTRSIINQPNFNVYNYSNASSKNQLSQWDQQGINYQFYPSPEQHEQIPTRNEQKPSPNFQQQVQSKMVNPNKNLANKPLSANANGSSPKQNITTGAEAVDYTKRQQLQQQEQYNNIQSSQLDKAQQLQQKFQLKIREISSSLQLQKNTLQCFNLNNTVQKALNTIQFSLSKMHFLKTAEYQTQVKKFEMTINNQTGQIRDLSAKLQQQQTLAQSCEKYRHANVDLTAKQQVMEQTIVDLQAKFENAKQDNVKISQLFQQLQDQNKLSEQIKQQKDLEILSLKQKQTSPQQLQKLQFENQQFQQQLIKKDQEIQQLLQSQQQIEQKDQQITDLQSENQQLQADLAKVQTVFTRVSQKAQEFDKLKLENDQLRQNILQLQQQNQNRMQPNAAAQQQVQNPQTQPTAQNVIQAPQQQNLQMQQPVNNLNQPSSHNAAVQQQKQPQQNKQNALPANTNLNINNQQKSANQNPYIDNNGSSMMDQQMMYKTDSANILNALNSISPKQNSQNKASNKPMDPQVNSIIQQQGQLQQQMNNMQKPLNVFQSESQQLKQNQQQQPLLDQVIQKPKSAEVFKPTVNSTFIKNNEKVDPNIQKQFEDSRIQRNKYEMDIKLAINEYNKQQGITIGNEGQQIIYSIQEKLQHFFKQQLILILVDDGKDLQFQNSAIFLNAVRISLLNKWIRQKETQIINYFVPQLEKVKELSDTKVKLNNIRRLGNLQNKMFQTDTGEPTYGLFRCLVVLLVLRMLNEQISM